MFTRPLIFGSESVQGFDDIESSAVCMADFLRERGVREGDRVLLKAGNSVGYVTVLLGLIHMGASIVLLDQQLSASDSAAMVECADVQLVVLDEDTLYPTETESISVLKLITEAQGRVPSAERVSPEAWRAREDALITFSSGSTGEPKAVVKGGAAVLDNLERTRKSMGYTPEDVMLPLLPFSHQYGMSILLLSWLVGCSLVITSYRRLDRALSVAGLSRTTVIDATPSVYRSVLSLLGRRPRLLESLASVRMYCTGGAPLGAALEREFEEEVGKPLLNGYGSSELGNISATTPENTKGCGQIFEGVEVEIRSVNDQSPLEAGEVGTIHVLTPDRFSGYLTDANTLTRPAPDTWYDTGDLGSVDEEGNIFVLGRQLAVHRNGYTLYPEMIERKAEECGNAVKVVALPDQNKGSLLVLLVEDPEQASAGYWRERVNAHLSTFERPSHVIVLADFPLTSNGKPDNAELTDIVHRHLRERAFKVAATT